MEGIRKWALLLSYFFRRFSALACKSPSHKAYKEILRGYGSENGGYARSTSKTWSLKTRYSVLPCGAVFLCPLEFDELRREGLLRHWDYYRQDYFPVLALPVRWLFLESYCIYTRTKA